MIKNISLTPWFPFNELSNIKGVDKPGVYLLGHFLEKPSCIEVNLLDDIIYIGETTKQTIDERLSQFAKSAFARKNGHSGGWTYSDLFLNSKQITNAPENLYVSLLSVDREEVESKAYIKYIERLLIWEFFKEQRKYPCCNTA